MTALRKLLYTSLLLMAHWHSCHAVEKVTLVQELDFGTVAVGGNNAFLTVDYSGSGHSTSGPIYMLSPPQPAHFSLSGYPPNTALSIIINDFFLTRGTGDLIWVRDFVHEPIITDASGNALLRIGANLHFVAGDIYLDRLYAGTLSVTVSH